MDNDDGYQPQGQEYPYPYSIPQSSAYDYQDYAREADGHVVFHDLDKKKNVVKSKAQPGYPNPAPTLYSIPQPAHPGKAYPVNSGKFFRAPPHPYHGPQIHQQTSQGPVQNSAKPKAKRGRRKKKTNESSDQSCSNRNAGYLQVQPGMTHHGKRVEDRSEKNHESSNTPSQKSTSGVMDPIPEHPPNLELDKIKTVGTRSLQSYPPTPQPVSLPDHPPNSIMNMRLDSIYYRTMDVENIREEDIDLNLLEGDDLELDDSMEERQAGPAQPETSKSTVSNGSSSGQNTNTPSPASIHDHEPPNSILNRTPATPASLHDHPPNSILNMRLDSIYYRTMDVENIGEDDIDLNLLEGDDDIDLDAMDTGEQPTEETRASDKPDSEDKSPKKPQGDRSSQGTKVMSRKSIQKDPTLAKSNQKLIQNPANLLVCTTPIQNSSTPSPTSINEQSSEQTPIQNQTILSEVMKETPIPAVFPASFPDHPPNSILNMRLDSIYYRTMDVENITEEDINLNLLEGDDLDFEEMDSSDKHQDEEVPTKRIIQNPRDDSNIPAASKKHQKTIVTEPEVSTTNQDISNPHHNRGALLIPASIPDHPPNSILNMRLDSIYYRTMDVENIGEEDIDLNLLEGDDIDLDETPEEPVLPTKQNESVQSESVQKPSSIQSTSSHDIGSSGNNITLSSSGAVKSTDTQNNRAVHDTNVPAPATPASLHDHPPNSIMNMRLDSIYYRTMDVENITEEDINLNLLEGDDIDLDDLDDKEQQEKIARNAPVKKTQKSVSKKKQTELGAPPTPANVHDHPPNSIMNMRLDSVYFRTIDVENITEEDINLNLLEGDDIDLDAMDSEEGKASEVPTSSSQANSSNRSSTTPCEVTPVQTTTKKSVEKSSEPLLNSSTPSPASNPDLNKSHKNSDGSQKIPEHPPNSILNLRLDSIYYRTMDVENIREEDVNLNLLMGDDDIDLEGIQKDNPRPKSRNQSLEDKNAGQQLEKSSERTLETRGRHMEYLDLDTMKTVGTQSLQSFPPTPQPAYHPPEHPPNSIMNLRLDSVYYRTMDVENIREEEEQVDNREKGDMNLEELESEEEEESESEDSKYPTKQLQRHNKNSTSPSSNITSSSEEEDSDENDDESSEDEEEEDVVVSIIKKTPKRNKSRILSGLCSNCSVKESTYWRKNKNGEQVCNPCALYEKTTGMKRPESLWQKEINRRDGTIDKELQIKKKENKEKRKRACIICEKSCQSVRNPPLCIPCRKGTANTAMECSVCGEGGKKLATYYFVKGKAECYRCYEKKINRKSKEGMARIAAEKEKAMKEAEAKAKEIEHIFAVPQLPTDKPRCHKCAVSGVRLVKSPLFEGSPLTCRKCYEAAYRKKKRSEKPPVPPKPKENHECVKCGATGVKMEKIDPVTKARTCKKCYNREMYLRNKEKKMKEGR
ncbi:unnamed protein product [Caenorhabditis brenneri]